MTKFLRIFINTKYNATTLAPFGIYVDEQDMNDEKLINHETIHWYQQLEMLIIFFYPWYFIEWGIKAITPPPGAYKDVGFERESYDNDDNLDYLKTRKPYAWFKYMFKR